MWLLIALLAPFLWASTTHIDKYLVTTYFKGASAPVLMVFTAIVGTLGAGVIAAVHPAAFRQTPLAAGVMLASGLLFMFATVVYYHALNQEEASVVAPFFQLATVWTGVMGWVFLHEKLTPLQLGGTALVLLGSALASWSGGGSRRGRHVKLSFVLTMVGVTLLLALSTVVFKFFAVRDDDFWGTTAWTLVGEAVFGVGVLCVPLYRRQFVHLWRVATGPLVTINTLNELITFGAGLASRFASFLAPVALVQALSGTSTIFTFLIGIVLTLVAPKYGRERLGGRDLALKGVMTVLVAAGAALMQLGTKTTG